MSVHALFLKTRSEKVNSGERFVLNTLALSKLFCYKIYRHYHSRNCLTGNKSHYNRNQIKYADNIKGISTLEIVNSLSNKPNKTFLTYFTVNSHCMLFVRFPMYDRHHSIQYQSCLERRIGQLTTRLRKYFMKT
jgi:hypothetical protein